MNSNKVTSTYWHPRKNLIITHISGDVDNADIERWQASLNVALARIKDGRSFKIFVNLFAFEAVNLEAHKKFRTIIPLTFAEYGWKAGYVDLFPEDSKTIQYTNVRGISCVAAAHCHHDVTKMELYETGYSSKKEHYFTEPAEAQKWIESLEVKN